MPEQITGTLTGREVLEGLNRQLPEGWRVWSVSVDRFGDWRLEILHDEVGLMAGVRDDLPELVKVMHDRAVTKMRSRVTYAKKTRKQSRKS